MILSGLKVSGYNYIGRPTLATIGNPAYWFDYRFNLVTQTYSGVLRANSLGDLSINSLLLQSIPVSSNTRRPKVYSDGIGHDDNLTAFRGSANSNLNFLLQGKAHLIISVFKLNAVGGNTLSLFSSGRTGSASYLFIVNPTSGDQRLFVRCNNDAGSTLFTNQTPIESLPLDEFCFIATLYYGGGTGSNNRKIWIKNSQYTFTSNPTYGTGDPDTFTVINSNGTVNYKLKMGVGYNLDGKSISECDAFFTLAVNTLKSDSEYSSLVTP
jgi:hypothetical protein